MTDSIYFRNVNHILKINGKSWIIKNICDFPKAFFNKQWYLSPIIKKWLKMQWMLKVKVTRGPEESNSNSNSKVFITVHTSVHRIHTIFTFAIIQKSSTCTSSKRDVKLIRTYESRIPSKFPQYFRWCNVSR